MSLTLPNVALLVSGVIGLVSIGVFLKTMHADVTAIRSSQDRIEVRQESFRSDLDTFRIRQLRTEWKLDEYLNEPQQTPERERATRTR